MKKINIVTLIFSFTFLATVTCFSQTYASLYEESTFEAYKKDSLNYDFFKSLFAIDTTMTEEVALKHEEKVLSLIKSFPLKEDKAKKEKRRVKFIYDELHKKFFKKYTLESDFSKIFEDGTYNCITASALYAFAFDELDIPYHVKETPSHVFLVAYPNTHKIYLETTVPGAYGFTTPKESEVKKIIDELIAYKLVTKEEVLEKGYIKFYEDYYYGKDYINKSALIGMQYYNKGLTNLDATDYDEAINNFRKAKIFYSSPLIKPILKGIMFLKVNELEFDSFEDVEFLFELLSISNYPEDYSISNLKTSLFKITDHDDNDHAFIEKVIDKFKLFKNEKIKNVAVEFLLEYLARRAASDEELESALAYSNEILHINPKSKIAKQIIEHVCFRKVTLSTHDLESLKDFEETCEKYPFLKDTKRYYISLVSFYGTISFMNYKNKEISLASEYLKKFESVMDKQNLINDINKPLVAELYLKAGNYYYYKEEHKVAYNLFKKGLSYVPGYPELEKKAQWAKEEL
ncbi:hypothetical protein [Snuella lapsa]|uniref:Tetratricopeptide repeat protein n=1 Tax=Snuella lapsa TaxID=870481 RepID=A0ABP6YAF8_9FLAO